MGIRQQMGVVGLLDTHWIEGVGDLHGVGHHVEVELENWEGQGVQSSLDTVHIQDVGVLQGMVGTLDLVEVHLDKVLPGCNREDPPVEDHVPDGQDVQVVHLVTCQVVRQVELLEVHLETHQGVHPEVQKLVHLVVHLEDHCEVHLEVHLVMHQVLGIQDLSVVQVGHEANGESR